MSEIFCFGPFKGSTGVLATQEIRTALAICAGLSGKQAARELGCAPSTIKKTVERIFFKLGVANRAGLISEALRRGLISFSSSASPSPDHQSDNQHDDVFLA